MIPEDDERGPEAPPDQHVHHDVDTPTVDDTLEIPKRFRRRRDASRRLPPLEHSGRRDPWCDTPPEASVANTAAARRAWCHLAAVGLTSETVLDVLRGAA